MRVALENVEVPPYILLESDFHTKHMGVTECLTD